MNIYYICIFPTWLYEQLLYLYFPTGLYEQLLYLYFPTGLYEQLLYLYFPTGLYEQLLYLYFPTGLYEQFWIDLSDMEVEGQFKWMSFNQNATYTNWIAGMCTTGADTQIVGGGGILGGFWCVFCICLFVCCCLWVIFFLER